MAKKYDFAGWATKFNIPCADGKTIMKGAFDECNNTEVPLVWNHDHKDMESVIGHALLETRADGVYAYCTLNSTENGETARQLVNSGDIKALSIYANKLKQDNNHNVMHGTIREVSLVLAGANPGAIIDSVISHSADDGEVMAFNCPEFSPAYSDNGLEICHSEEEQEETIEHAQDDKKEEPKSEEKKEDGKTGQEILDAMTDEQRDAFYEAVGAVSEGSNELSDESKAIIEKFNEEQTALLELVLGEVVENKDKEKEDNKENAEMKHNVFEGEKQPTIALDFNAVISDAKKFGSLKDSFMQHTADLDDESLAHALEYNGTAGVDYGIANINYLFPDNKYVNNTPELLKRDTDWVNVVMGAVNHTAFSRIKTMYADLTADAARAKGYVTGTKKVEEVISLARRSTDPQTIYKKQKLDRDDIIDITGMDVVAWLKGEMRLMLDEEIARAILIGDGRSVSADDKIKEDHIRPIAKDDSLYTIKVSTDLAQPAKVIDDIVSAQDTYEGSGNLVMFTLKSTITKLLLLKDTTGRRIYNTITELATALGVNKIVPCPVMNGAVDANGNAILAILVDLKDYYIGADKGGAVNMFDDFDIDFNQQKYLIETRCSGALVKLKSAICITQAPAEPETPAETPAKTVQG